MQAGATIQVWQGRRGWHYLARINQELIGWNPSGAPTRQEAQRQAIESIIAHDAKNGSDGPQNFGSGQTPQS